MDPSEVGFVVDFGSVSFLLQDNHSSARIRGDGVFVVSVSVVERISHAFLGCDRLFGGATGFPKLFGSVWGSSDLWGGLVFLCEGLQAAAGEKWGVMGLVEFFKVVRQLT